MKKYLFLPAIFILFLNSCISTKYVLIDVYEPATVSFPPEAVYVSLVDNTLMYPETLPDNPAFGSTIQVIPMDSTIVAFQDSLIKYMNNEQYFGEVFVYPDRIRLDEEYGKEKPLSFSQIRNICKEADADVIISIDDFTLNGKIYKTQDPILMGYISEMALNLNIKMRVWSADGNELSQPIVLCDTLYWSELGEEYPYFQNLPPLSDALNVTAAMAAQALVKQFIPYWETQQRSYFTDNSGDMKKADKLVQAGKWQEALVIWRETYEKEAKDIKRARLAHNIALASECANQIDEAVEWGEKAMELTTPEKTEYTSTIQYYNTLLKLRKASLQKLEVQIGKMNED